MLGDKDGKCSIPRSIPGLRKGKKARVYVLLPEILSNAKAGVPGVPRPESIA
jgi:hypothetical protein